MTERWSPDDLTEDDGVLEPGDTLDDDLGSDVLDTGIDAGEGYRGATRYGVTADEARDGETFDQLLAEEESDVVHDDWTDEDEPPDDGEAQPRAGRLVAVNAGVHGDAETDAVANDVGVDGAGASAEESAVHITEDPPYT
jgi:Family of unknown function (DUF5709)